MYGAHVAMKFLARIQTLAFRRQALTLGGGLIMGWLKDGWDPNGIKLSPKQSRNREVVEL
jgi:hypothetical protein